MNLQTHTHRSRDLRRNIKLVVALSAFVASATFANGSANAEDIRVATLAPDGSAWMKVLSKGAQKIESATEGRVKIKYYANGSQGDEKDVVRKLGLGQLDGAALTSVGLSLIEKSVRVLELPRLFRTEAEVDFVRGKMWKRIQKRFAKKGYQLAPKGGDVGWIYLYSNTPIKSLGDLKKVKMWRWSEDGIVKAMFGKLGINGVPLGVPEVMSALNTGRINAVYGSPVAMVALQWYTKIKYATSLPMSYGIGGSVMRTEVWNKISEADQKAITKILKSQAMILRRTIRKDNVRALKAMQKAGVKVIETPKDVVDAVDSAATGVWASKASKSDLETVQKNLATKR